MFYMYDKQLVSKFRVNKYKILVYIDYTDLFFTSYHYIYLNSKSKRLKGNKQWLSY